LNTMYEGLFIFPETLDEEGLDQSLGRVKEELEKLGGSIKSTTRMGKKTFARPLKKQKAGYYVMLMIEANGLDLDAFKARLKLSTDVFRHQFIVASAVEEATQEA